MNKITAGTNLIHQEINPDGITQADVVVIIPSFNEVAHIELATKKAGGGLGKFYPGLTSVIINCDNCSQDGTKEAFFAAECPISRIYISSPEGIKGKGANLVNAFRMASTLKAKVVAIVDANLTSVKTTWIPKLLSPVLDKKAEYVAPIYVRHKYDGPITRSLGYPLMRMLFGRRVIQPLCVDHAFSGRLNEIYLNCDWDLDDAGYRADIKMLSRAIMNNAAICQSFMAYPRTTSLGQLDHDIPQAFANVATSLFELALETPDYWRNITRTRPTCLAFVDEEPLMPSRQIEVNAEEFLNGFIELGKRYKDIWASYLPGEIVNVLEKGIQAAISGVDPAITSDMWRTVIFEALLAFKNATTQSRSEIAASLSPLFLAKQFTIISQPNNLTEQQYNSLMEKEALGFEKSKAELVTRWFS